MSECRCVTVKGNGELQHLAVLRLSLISKPSFSATHVLQGSSPQIKADHTSCNPVFSQPTTLFLFFNRRRKLQHNPSAAGRPHHDAFVAVVCFVWAVFSIRLFVFVQCPRTQCFVIVHHHSLDSSQPAFVREREGKRKLILRTFVCVI